MIFQSAAATARVESPGQVPLRVLSTIFAVLRVLRVALLQSQGFSGWRGCPGRGRPQEGGEAAGGVAAPGQMQSINGSAWWYTPDEWQPHGAFPFAAATLTTLWVENREWRVGSRGSRVESPEPGPRNLDRDADWNRNWQWRWQDVHFTYKSVDGT